MCRHDLRRSRSSHTSTMRGAEEAAVWLSALRSLHATIRKLFNKTKPRRSRSTPYRTACGSGKQQQQQAKMQHALLNVYVLRPQHLCLRCTVCSNSERLLY